MPTDVPDSQLLLDRDSNAWDELYRAVCRRTYRLLHTVTGAKKSVLEELNQEVWLSAISSIERFDATRGTPQDWVLGIARFKGLTYLRKQYTSRLVFAGSSSELPQLAAAPAETSDREERLMLLRAAIASLPENWQYLLRQKYEAGLSVKEMSELAGITVKTVESKLARARQRLRDLYRNILREMPEL